MIASLMVLLGLALAAVPVASGALKKNAGWLLAIPLLVAAGLAISVFSSSTIHTESYSWIPSLGADLNFRLDGLSMVFLMLVLLIGAGVLMYSTHYLHHKDATFYFFIVGFATAMSMLVTTNDLVVFYVSWEMTTLCSYFLIANSGEKGRRPAIRTLLVTVFGGLLLLTATVVMAVGTGTMKIDQIITSSFWDENPGTLTLVAILVAGAAFTKSAQFPFQAWLPDSMVAIAPVSAYLHAAAMVKAGIYLILRYSPLFADIQIWNIMLVVSGGFTALFGAMTAVRRDDLKELLAYSTMSQLGLLVLVVGIGSEAAIMAAIVHTIAHACFKAALFMSVGIVEHETGTRSYSELRRMRIDMLATKVIVAISAMSMAGVPFLFGFVSKEGLITVAYESPLPSTVNVLLVAVIVMTSIFTFAYSFRYILGVFGQPAGELEDRELAGETVKTVKEASPAFWIVPAMLSVVTLVGGLLPKLFDGIVSAAATAATGASQHAHLAIFHGINIPLALSVFIMTAGAVLVLYQRHLLATLAAFNAPVKGTWVVDFLRDNIVNFGERHVASASGTTSMRRHLSIPMILIMVLGIVGMFTLGGIDPVPAERSENIDWIFTLVIAIGVAATVMAKSRLTTVVVISMTGFGMILWFFSLGAADVAMTQLMVEFLTVCILVLILHRLPDYYTPETKQGKFWAMVMAAGMGITTMLGVLALTGHREKSELAKYFLEETYAETHGHNIVNVILVDFRAFDTFGELTVLGMAGLAIASLLNTNKLAPIRENLLDVNSPVFSGSKNSIFLRVTTKIIGPIIIVLSVVLFYRGHQEPGGGFIAALVGASGFALLYLAAPKNNEARIKWPYFVLIGAGIFIAAATAIAGYAQGSLLTSIDFVIFGQHQSSALLFDLGVYLAVVGVIVLSLNLLGLPQNDDDEETIQLDEKREARLAALAREERSRL